MPLLAELNEMRNFVRDNPGSFDASIDRIVSILQKYDIKHALAGALAQAHYVEDPRTTKDVDIAIVTDMHLDSIALMLSNYGYKKKDIYRSDTAILESLVTVDPSGMRVDLLSVPSFMLYNSEIVPGLTVPVVNRNAVAAMKYLASQSRFAPEFKQHRYMSDYKELLETGGAVQHDVELYLSMYRRE